MVFTSDVATAFGSFSSTLTLTGSNTGDNTLAGKISNIGGSATISLAKSGSGKWVLGGANPYTGTTTVGGGTLEIGGALTATTQVTVNSGGTLLLSGTGGTNFKLNTVAPMTLAGGKLDLRGMTSSLDQTVGALTLSASSIIDFGTLGAGNTFRFADSASATWSGLTLSIWNWTSGSDHLFFGNGSGTGLQPSQLDKIKFFSDSGTTILPYAPGFSGFTGGFGEVVPVPEPSGAAVAMGLVGLIVGRERSRFMKRRQSSRLPARK